MSQTEKKFSVPTATLDISVEYKGEPLNNCVIQLFNAEGTYYSGKIELGDSGRKAILVSQTMLNVILRVLRSPKAPQDDSSKYPSVSIDQPLGSIMDSGRVTVVVAEPAFQPQGLDPKR
jgi:hypothetical protein